MERANALSFEVVKTFCFCSSLFIFKVIPNQTEAIFPFDCTMVDSSLLSPVPCPWLAKEPVGNLVCLPSHASPDITWLLLHALLPFFFPFKIKEKKHFSKEPFHLGAAAEGEQDSK